MATDARPCLVTGGTGFLGRHLLPALVARGWQVRVLAREPRERAVRQQMPGVEYVWGDLSSPSALAEGVRGVRAVFHFAGEKRNSARFTAVNVEGTRALLEACARAGAPPVVHLSSVGVVGRPATNTVDETSRCRPQPGYELSKHQAEQVAREYQARTGAQVTILRPANVFGDGDPEHHLLTVMRAIRSGRFRLIGRREAWLNYVYAGDVAEACALVAETAPDGQIYHLSDPCTVGDFARHIGAELGITSEIGRLPVGAAYGASIALSALAMLTRRPWPLTFGKVQALRSRRVYSGERFRRDHPGWPALGWKAGITRTIAGYRSEGLL